MRFLKFYIVSFLILQANLLSAQTLSMAKVVNQQGEPIPNTYIQLKGQKQVITTNEKGEWVIPANLSFPLEIIISHVGYEIKKITIAEAAALSGAIVLQTVGDLSEVVVSSRRRLEKAQDIPIALTVLGGTKVDEAGAFNVNRLKELIPAVQLYSSNPRNTTLNIRGLGSTFGLTNDGIEPGVGFYIDGVYHARPAVTALDFVDVDRIEVLRGPQGTLFGKNTTAGAFNIFTKKPSFTPSAKFELSYGNYNFIQAKASFSGQVARNVAARFSFSGTDRQGTIFHEKQQQYYNGLNNVGFKGQVLWKVNNKLELLFSGDYNTQNPDGYSLVVAGITTTQRSAYRQYAAIVADLGYQLPTVNPFARRIETDAPWKHNQIISGAHLNAEYKVGKATLTSTTAWRFWNWDPVNDRDFTAIPALTRSQANSRHHQFSQEFRYAGEIAANLTGVAGVYYLQQRLFTPFSQFEEVGPAQWRFVQTSNSGTQALYNPNRTPGLLDNFGIRTNFNLESLSTAVFGQLDWEPIKGLHILPGLRYNYDKKELDYSRQTYGGLQTADPVLLSLKRAVYTDQAFVSAANNTNVSANITVSYKPSDRLNVYATYSNNYKSVGLNLGGLPTKAGSDSADLSLSQVKPEYVQHYEFGIKSQPFKGAILNFTVFNTNINDYQTTVQVPQIGLNRGYLANAEKVNVKGVELDFSYQPSKNISFTTAVAYTDGKYVSFKNAPLPLEETGKTVNGQQVAFKDVSGGRLPGISRWNFSSSVDWSFANLIVNKYTGKLFAAVDASYRSDYSSNPTPSAVLNIDAYALVNARFGFRSEKFSAFIWARNLTNTQYFEQLQAAAGNSGLIAGVLGDPQTYGITFKTNF